MKTQPIEERLTSLWARVLEYSRFVVWCCFCAVVLIMTRAIGLDRGVSIGLTLEEWEATNLHALTQAFFMLCLAIASDRIAALMVADARRWVARRVVLRHCRALEQEGQADGERTEAS